jgi:hypothetical protein
MPRVRPFITDAEVERAMELTLDRYRKAKGIERRRGLKKRLVKLKELLQAADDCGLIDLHKL